MNIKQTRSAAEIVVIEDEGGYAFFGDSAQLDSWLTGEGLLAAGNRWLQNN